MTALSYYKFCSSRVILVKEGKVLLELRDSCEYACNQWMIPGGHTERSETAIDSAVRELAEELNIKIKKIDLRFVSAVHWWNEKHQRSGITFFWTTQNWSGDITRLEQNKCAELRWFGEAELQQVDVEITSRKTLDVFFTGEFGKYLEADWPEEEEPEDAEYDCE